MIQFLPVRFKSNNQVAQTFTSGKLLEHH
jgi:hypothetical protein